MAFVAHVSQSGRVGLCGDAAVSAQRLVCKTMRSAQVGPYRPNGHSRHTEHAD